MKNLVIAFSVLALSIPIAATAKDDHTSFGGPLFADAFPPVTIQEGGDYNAGVVSFGLFQQSSDTISSKFLEYRDIPNGAVAPFFRLKGKKGDYRYELIGHDVTQSDQRYFGRFEGKSWRFQVNYTGIPHHFGNGGKSILIPVEQTDKTEWRISDSLQQSFQASIVALPVRNYATVLPIVQPTLDSQPSDINIGLQRNRMNLAFSLFPAASKFNIDVTYFNERRTGSRTNNGTSFGFNNVVETADPIRYVSQDFGVRASTKNDWGIVFAGVHVNDFSNKYDTFAWDNPFRATDSTDSSAYLGPYSTVNGPSTGLMALFPSNQAWTANGGTNLFLGHKTRLSADVQFGQWSQNQQPFIPYTTNTAITTPSGQNATDPSILPASHLDGKIDVLALNGYFTTKVTNDFRLNARYRFYRNDNKTPRISFPEGYVRFDGVWENIGRISVPYGWDSNYLDFYGTYDVGSMLGFEVGYKYNQISRKYRESDDTTENTIRAAADLRFGGGVLVRALYELGKRDYNDYNGPLGEDYSFLNPGAPANQTVLRRYDQAKRDRDRLGIQLQLTPASGIVSVSAAYFLNNDKYNNDPVPCEDATAADLKFCSSGSQTPLGLQKAEYKTFSLDMDVTPNDRYNLYVFYSREDMMDFQTGRQSGGTLVFDPAFNWSSQADSKVNSLGGGATVSFVPDKWVFDLFYRYQKVDGNNAFTAGSGLRNSTTNPVVDIPLYDDTKISYLSAQLRHNFATDWTLGIGSSYEIYRIEDTQTGSVLNYVPGAFFVNANNGDYNAWVGWLNMTYRF
jgi:Putative outer membrane beta-barrel porin, MtrB/PioB